MIKVITYGTFDVLHYGHLRLLERAKALGDYLIVGITSDDFDKTRGKINNQQSLMERIKGIRETGLADEIIVEEYEGQKIDDIIRLGVNIFTVGSDWVGQFDYLNEYCKVIYLPRTEGVSSSELRTEKRKIKLGIVGNAPYREKFCRESKFVNGVEISGFYDISNTVKGDYADYYCAKTYDELLKNVDAVYVISNPKEHYKDVKKALCSGKHVLCESPVAMTREECRILYNIAEENNLILMDAIKTAYSTAFERMILLAKAGKIGDIVSVDAVCTSLKDGILDKEADNSNKWNSICAWAPTAMIPIFQIFGINYTRTLFFSKFLEDNVDMDIFTKIDFIYPNGVATVKVAKGAKAEGDLIVSGTKGYIYVPAPWWKTEYFEVRYEKQEDNKRFFYQLDGEGIRYEIVAFVKSIQSGRNISYISKSISETITGVIEDFENKKEMTIII